MALKITPFVVAGHSTAPFPLHIQGSNGKSQGREKGVREQAEGRVRVLASAAKGGSMLPEEREFRRNWRPWDERKAQFDKDYRAMRRAVREDVLSVARECHHFHRCNHLDPCELCLMMNPNWKSTAAMRKGGKG